MGTAQRTDDDRVVIPSEQDYAAADEALSEAFGAIETLEWQLRDLVPNTMPEAGRDGFLVAWEPARPVTAADVGLLWSFIDGIDLKLDVLAETRRRLYDALSRMDSIRLDQTVREKDAR